MELTLSRAGILLKLIYLTDVEALLAGVGGTMEMENHRAYYAA